MTPPNPSISPCFCLSPLGFSASQPLASHKPKPHLPSPMAAGAASPMRTPSALAASTMSRGVSRLAGSSRPWRSAARIRQSLISRDRVLENLVEARRNSKTKSGPHCSVLLKPGMA
ncbi:hypothetical protein TARUN_5613 [Trichoderma arundinaceum]|uniref:Uncharacterized protein n=1 Tax=Trichoderma arundinaceum TaxID=490622 RepID=A0A395NL60_TRIAR|nr:hypothetical protein TARUN_5613 [Trichoderma arundinaceum]